MNQLLIKGIRDPNLLWDIRIGTLNALTQEQQDDWVRMNLPPSLIR
jgi:hypothetical protein